MRNPRIIVTISADAKAALKRVSAKTNILEADLLRMAIGSILRKYGEEVDVSIDRGGDRRTSDSD